MAMQQYISESLLAGTETYTGDIGLVPDVNAAIFHLIWRYDTLYIKCIILLTYCVYFKWYLSHQYVEYIFYCFCSFLQSLHLQHVEATLENWGSVWIAPTELWATSALTLPLLTLSGNFLMKYYSLRYAGYDLVGKCVLITDPRRIRPLTGVPITCFVANKY